jgi:hypothetical protein
MLTGLPSTAGRLARHRNPSDLRTWSAGRDDGSDGEQLGDQHPARTGPREAVDAAGSGEWLAQPYLGEACGPRARSSARIVVQIDADRRVRVFSASELAHPGAIAKQQMTKRAVDRLEEGAAAALALGIVDPGADRIEPSRSSTDCSEGKSEGRPRPAAHVAIVSPRNRYGCGLADSAIAPGFGASTNMTGLFGRGAF